MATIIIIITFIFAIGIITVYFINRAEQRKLVEQYMREIHKCESIEGIVMAVNHGRVYPFFTGMSLAKVKSIVKNCHPNVGEFDERMQLCEFMGLTPFVDLPTPQNKFIKNVSVHINKNNIASTIIIHIKNFDLNFERLSEEMVLKFGRPTSVSSEFIIWREGTMVINITHSGSIMVLDERL